MKWNIMLSVLLISLLAVGAYAQTENETKQPTRQDGSEDTERSEDAVANQNYVEYENAQPAAPHDPSGPAGENAQGSANQGSEAVVTDKDLDVETAGGDQVQGRKYGNGQGETHELGESPRRGEDFAGDPGAKGPFGTPKGGPDETFLEMFGLEETFGFETDSAIDKSSDENCDGEMWQHSWGPGESTSGGPVGPNVEGVGFGPSGDSAPGSDPTNDGVQSRTRRR